MSRTYLYSLTKQVSYKLRLYSCMCISFIISMMCCCHCLKNEQDIALRDVPGMYESSRPIIHYIRRQIESIYEVDTVRIDRNQPHVLKYSSEDRAKHTGVELHHDKCDLTVNIMLPRSNTYVGGGE